MPKFSILKQHISSLLSKVKYWQLPLIVSILAMSCYFFQDYDYLWDYQKAKLLQGELWRLFTGHFSHTNHIHLLLNLSALLLLTFMHSHFYKPKMFISLFFYCAIIVSLGLFFTSDIEQYVGLSGVLHGLFIWGACKDVQIKEPTGIWLLLGIIIKVIYEQVNGQNNELAQLINANVAIDAHLWGAIAGLTFFFLVWLTSRQPIKRNI